MRFVKSALLFVVFFAAVPLLGQMNATMNRGETRTFTVDIDFTVQTFAVSGPLIVVVNASPELVLGKTTLSVPFNCNETFSVTTCRGTATMSGAQKITLTQRITVSADASRSSGTWTVQLVGDGLSGTSPKTGTITIPNAGPKVIMTLPPKGLVRSPTTSAVPALMEFKNVGDAATTISVTSSKKTIFEFSETGFLPEHFPTLVFSLAPQQAKDVLAHEVATTKKDRDQGGLFIDVATASGEGVVPGLDKIRLGLLVRERPAQAPKPEPSSNRVDQAAAAGDPNPKGSVTFTNTGAGAVAGLPNSDAPWLVPSDEELSLQPGESKPLNFTIDLAKQAEGLADTGGIGSLSGTLTLHYLLPASGKSAAAITPLGDPPGTGSTSVTIVSTVKASVVDSTIPPLSENHAQLFLAGVGHVVGSVGLFISDLAIFPQVARSQATESVRSLTDVDMYYTPLGGGTSRKATLASLATPNVAAFGDLVGTVYGTTQQVGSLQIRTPGFLSDGSVGINANVFNVSGATGTYGTAIPVFRVFKFFECGQDRPTKKLSIPGLRRDASGHTNFYIQEICGSNVKVTLDFLDPNGNKLDTRTEDVAPFTAIQLGSGTLPDGAVSAVLSHAPGSAGGFAAYATPVDRASGDTWAQVDWPSLRRYAGNVPVIIPVAGALPGANNTYFRTDVSIMNTGTTPGAGTLRFYNRTGEVIDKTINLNPLQTGTYVDVTTTLFGITTPHVGYMTFTPTAGNFAVTSRNYSTPVGSNATFGTAVPILALTSALRPTQVRRIGGIEDAAPDTISAQRPATFRSNIGLIETAGAAATVKVTVFYRYTGSLTSTTTGASATFDLAPGQFVLVGLGNAIFGADRAAAGDLHNVMVEFEVTGGTGNVLPFVSSIDNGTGDSTFRVE